MCNKRKENLIALKELLKDAIRKDAQNVYEFEKMVNKVTLEAIGCHRITATGNYVANMVMGDMCDRIINSRMSMDDKECILGTMSYLLDIAENGSVLSAMSAEERQKTVEEAAKEYIKTHKDVAEKMYPTGGTTETHKTEVVE